MTFLNSRCKETLERLWRYGVARNREVDTEPRIITLTDDEALDVLVYITELEER